MRIVESSKKKQRLNGRDFSRVHEWMSVSVRLAD
jgi:hypothetical protein